MSAISLRNAVARSLLGLFLAWPSFASAGQAEKPDTSRTLTASQSRPNLLVLCSDQQHWQAMGFVDKFFDTPAQDALARESVVFDRSFCTTPQCSPSRSSMLTGFYPHRTGVMGNVGASGGGKLKIPTVGAALQKLGYVTGYFGKWHLGNDPTGNAGWDEEVKQGPDAKTTERGVDFIQRHAGDKKPFALFLMYVDPHDIYHFRPDAAAGAPDNTLLGRAWAEESFADKPSVQKEFMTDNQGKIIWGKPQAAWQQYHDFYRRKVKLYDDHVAAVVNAIKQQGLWDSTVIVSTSDHGDMDTNHKLIFKGPFMYEHMVRVPTMIRVPAAFGGVGPKRVNDYDWVNVDLNPTLLELAGSEAPRCDGQSAVPILTGKGNVRPRPFVIGQYYGKQTWVNPIRMIRTERYKLNVYIDHGEELYDLQKDPQELVNLAADPAYTEARQRLKSELDQWIAEHHDPFYSLSTTQLRSDESKKIGTGRKQKKTPARKKPLGDGEAFRQLLKADWHEVLRDPGTESWKDHWFLDGQVGQVKNTPQGMELRAGPEFKNDAHHMVLWTKEPYAGDLKIEYEYTRLDSETRCVTILYLQATGSGSEPYATDISKWNQLRTVPAMRTYFNHMNTYHVSYAAFPDDGVHEDYIRARRYIPDATGLRGTDLTPDYFDTGLFETGVPHNITIIKSSQELFMQIRNAEKQMLCHWKNDSLPPITSGRIGLRHMYTRAARYRDFRISTLK